MIILAIDTALAAAQACVFDAISGQSLAQETLWMARGHDQTIMPLIDKTVQMAGIDRSALDKIAVTVGPGSFAGLRVGLAAAQAIGLALKRPVVGVSTLSAYIAPLVLSLSNGVAAAAIDARNEKIYFTALSDGQIIVPPCVTSPREASLAMGSGPFWLAGSAAPSLAIEAWSRGAAAEVMNDAPAPDISYVARLGAAADPHHAPARPFYLVNPSFTKLSCA